MALRSFADPEGTPWDVWEVTSYAVRAPESHARRTDDAQGNLVPVPGAGWLCFQSAGEKRRLTPIPARWAELPPSALAELLRSADPVQRARGRKPHSPPDDDASDG